MFPMRPTGPVIPLHGCSCDYCSEARAAIKAAPPDAKICPGCGKPQPYHDISCSTLTPMDVGRALSNTGMLSNTGRHLQRTMRDRANDLAMAGSASVGAGSLREIVLPASCSGWTVARHETSSWLYDLTIPGERPLRGITAGQVHGLIREYEHLQRQRSQFVAYAPEDPRPRANREAEVWRSIASGDSRFAETFIPSGSMGEPLGIDFAAEVPMPTAHSDMVASMARMARDGHVPILIGFDLAAPGADMSVQWTPEEIRAIRASQPLPIVFAHSERTLDELMEPMPGCAPPVFKGEVGRLNSVWEHTLPDGEKIDVPRPCCGQYATCWQDCVPRADWVAVNRPSKPAIFAGAVQQSGPCGGDCAQCGRADGAAQQKPAETLVLGKVPAGATAMQVLELVEANRERIDEFCGIKAAAGPHAAHLPADGVLRTIADAWNRAVERAVRPRWLALRDSILVTQQARKPLAPALVDNAGMFTDPDGIGLVASAALSTAGYGMEWSGMPGDPFITLRRTRGLQGTEPGDLAAGDAS